jgi:hypothetical protein
LVFAGGGRQKACFGNIVKTGFLLVALANLSCARKLKFKRRDPIGLKSEGLPGAAKSDGTGRVVQR